MKVSVLALLASTAFGAISNVQLRVTSTQASLSYIAPDASACSVEVSESPSYRPLVHDVDPVLYSGSNLDSRPEGITGAEERVFVAGKRRAEKGLDGKWYSRALQAFTTHYYRITCGSSRATGTFATANIALGNTYNEPLPADPSVSSRPYYSSVGSYAWPEFVNWNNQDPAARSESVIDPQTGLLLKRLALPQDQPIDYLPGAGDHAFTSGASPDGAWSVPNAAIADDATAATFKGSQSNFLVLNDQSLWNAGGTNLADITLPTEWITLSLKAWCSGACAGEDAKIQACVTINGVTCWPTNATAKYQEATLGTSPTGTFVTLGTTVPILDSWTPAGFAPLNRADISRRVGLANVDASGGVTWQKGGFPNTYFSANWTSGSRISIGASECTVTTVQGLTRLTIDPASCSTPLSLPLTGVTFSGASFGFLVRKKTAGTDTINVQYAKYTMGTSQYMDFNATGSGKFCSDTLTVNTATGGLGYHCVVPSGWPMLYWVDHKTGDASYLGQFSRSSVSGADGFGGGLCDGTNTLGGTIPTASESFYCTATDNETPAKAILVSCLLNSTNRPGNQTVTCSNLTPGTRGKDIIALIAAFTASDTPAFDGTRFACSVTGRQGDKLVIGCGRSVQDTVGWTVMFDPAKVGSAPGCVGGGAPGCVVAAASSWAAAPARWCATHTRFVSGKTDTLWIAGKFFQANSPAQLGDGPYVSTIISAALSAIPAVAAGTGVCPAGSAGCDVVTVDGEPCDPSPAAGEASGSNVCPKNAAWAYLQDAKVGDVFFIDNEAVMLVAKNGNQWTLRRGYGMYGVAAHGSPTLSATCMARDFDHGVSNFSWTWDTAADPHGVNSDGTTVKVAWDYDHPVPRTSVTLGGVPSYDSNCVIGGGICYAIRDGVGSMGDPPNRYVALGPTFSGAGGPSMFIERSQDHPSWLQDTAPSSERQWFTDGRPLAPLMDFSDAAMSVSGQLYRLTSTTADGDNLGKIGYNLYVVRSSANTLVAAGNCTSGNPCTIWNDTFLLDAINKSCTITLNSGSGTVYVSRLASGGLGVTYTNGLSISTDACPTAAGGGYPGGSTPLWMWTASGGTWAAAGTDNRGGSSGLYGAINRRIQPTWASCGTQALIDVSSAATGNVLSDTSTDSYKYCVARKGGECRAGSQQGDIYVNCPNVTKRPSGSYGCNWISDNQEKPVDICVGNMSAYLNSVVQVGFKQNDFSGALGRSLSKGMARYRLMDDYWHGKSLSDGSWLMFRSMYTNGAWTDILLGKLPPYPPTDTVARSKYQPIPVKLTPPAGLAVDNAIVQFGYAENGLAGNFYCTSRQEKCLATASTLPATPFAFPSDGAGGVESGVAGLACSNGCTIAVPAISQRMLYYQVKYRDASNKTLASGRMEVIAIP
ncbi:MAG: hypothetical protein JWP63_2435 [Candidatus Solibacter sp.]|nr:hypothetical protein [Candidatus Solibacter sp.]